MVYPILSNINLPLHIIQLSAWTTSRPQIQYSETSADFESGSGRSRSQDCCLPPQQKGSLVSETIGARTKIPNFGWFAGSAFLEPTPPKKNGNTGMICRLTTMPIDHPGASRRDLCISGRDPAHLSRNFLASHLRHHQLPPRNVLFFFSVKYIGFSTNHKPTSSYQYYTILNPKKRRPSSDGLSTASKARREMQLRSSSLDNQLSKRSGWCCRPTGLRKLHFFGKPKWKGSGGKASTCLINSLKTKYPIMSHPLNLFFWK